MDQQTLQYQLGECQAKALCNINHQKRNLYAAGTCDSKKQNYIHVIEYTDEQKIIQLANIPVSSNVNKLIGNQEKVYIIQQNKLSCVDYTNVENQLLFEIPFNNLQNAIPVENEPTLILSNNKQIVQYDLNKQQFNTIIESEEQYSLCEQDPYHSQLFARAQGNYLCIHDTRERKVTNRIKAHGLRILDLDFNPNKQYYLLSGGEDCMAKIWDIRKTQYAMKSFDDLQNSVLQSKFNKFHDQLIALSYDDGTFSLHNVASVSSVPQMGQKDEDYKVQVYDDHEDSIYGLAWSSALAWIIDTLAIYISIMCQQMKNIKFYCEMKAQGLHKLNNLLESVNLRNQELLHQLQSDMLSRDVSPPKIVHTNEQQLQEKNKQLMEDLNFLNMSYKELKLGTDDLLQKNQYLKKHLKDLLLTLKHKDEELKKARAKNSSPEADQKQQDKSIIDYAIYMEKQYQTLEDKVKRYKKLLDKNGFDEQYTKKVEEYKKQQAKDKEQLQQKYDNELNSLKESILDLQNRISQNQDLHQQEIQLKDKMIEKINNQLIKQLESQTSLDDIKQINQALQNKLQQQDKNYKELDHKYRETEQNHKRQYQESQELYVRNQKLQKDILVLSNDNNQLKQLLKNKEDEIQQQILRNQKEISQIKHELSNKNQYDIQNIQEKLVQSDTNSKRLIEKVNKLQTQIEDLELQNLQLRQKIKNNMMDILQEIKLLKDDQSQFKQQTLLEFNNQLQREQQYLQSLKFELENSSIPEVNSEEEKTPRQNENIQKCVDILNQVVEDRGDNINFKNQFTEQFNHLRSFCLNQVGILKQYAAQKLKEQSEVFQIQIKHLVEELNRQYDNQYQQEVQMNQLNDQLERFTNLQKSQGDSPGKPYKTIDIDVSPFGQDSQQFFQNQQVEELRCDFEGNDSQSLREQLNSIEQQIEQMRGTIKDQESNLKNRDEKLGMSEQKIKQLQTELDQAKQKGSSASKAQKEYEQNNQKLQTELTNIKKEMEKLNQKSNRVDQLDAELGKLKKIKTKQDTQISALQTEINTKNTEINQLSLTKQQQEQQIQQLKSENDKQKQESDTQKKQLEQEIISLQQSKGSEKIIQDLQKEIQEKQTSFERVSKLWKQSQQQQLQRRQDLIKKTHQIIQQFKLQFLNEKSLIQNELSIYKEQLEEISQQLAQKLEPIRDLKEQIFYLRHLLMQLKNQVISIQIPTNGYQELIELIDQQKNKYDNSLNQQHEQLKQKEEKIQNLLQNQQQEKNQATQNDDQVKQKDEVIQNKELQLQQLKNHLEELKIKSQQSIQRLSEENEKLEKELKTSEKELVIKSKELENLQQENINLQEEYDEQIQNLQEQIQSLQEQNLELNQKLEQEQQQSINELQAQKENYTKEIEYLNEQIAEKHHKIKDLENEVQDKDTSISKSQREARNLQDQVQELKEQLISLQNNIIQVPQETQFNEQIGLAQNLKNELLECKSILQKSLNNLDTVKSSIEQTNVQIEQNQILDLQELKCDLQGEIPDQEPLQRSKEEVPEEQELSTNQLKQQIEVLKMNLQSKTQGLDDNVKILQELRKQLAEVSAKNQQQEDQIKILEKTQQEKQQALDETLIKLKQKEDLLVKFQALSQNQSVIDELRRQLTEATTLNEQQSSQIQQLEQQLIDKQQISDKLQSLKNESDILEQKNKEILEQIQNKDDQIKQLQEQKSQNEDMIKKLQDQLVLNQQEYQQQIQFQKEKLQQQEQVAERNLDQIQKYCSVFKAEITILREKAKVNNNIFEQFRMFMTQKVNAIVKQFTQHFVETMNTKEQQYNHERDELVQQYESEIAKIKQQNQFDLFPANQETEEQIRAQFKQEKESIIQEMQQKITDIIIERDYLALQKTELQELLDLKNNQIEKLQYQSIDFSDVSSINKIEVQEFNSSMDHATIIEPTVHSAHTNSRNANSVYPQQQLFNVDQTKLFDLTQENETLKLEIDNLKNIQRDYEEQENKYQIMVTNLKKDLIKKQQELEQTEKATLLQQTRQLLQNFLIALANNQETDNYLAILLNILQASPQERQKILGAIQQIAKKKTSTGFFK
ncbi:hypothetical protein pb186bvf_011766 [Paramecium bursaria]